MSGPPPDPIPGAPRFFLAATPDAGAPELAEGELEHALRVLRLGIGDPLLGLDGRGTVWPLAVRARTQRALELEPAGEPMREPEPGAPGSALPWVELALSMPRGERAEELVDRATQLGASAIRWLTCERTPPRVREPSAHRLARLERVAREATKQCRRLWVPETGAPVELEEFLAGREGARSLVLDLSREAPPLAEQIDTLASSGRFDRARPLVLCAGPEGGFEERELAMLDGRGAVRARLGPLVLRIETAAEAALAIALHRFVE